MKRDVTVVPFAALLERPGGSVAFVAVPDGAEAAGADGTDAVDVADAAPAGAAPGAGDAADADAGDAADAGPTAMCPAPAMPVPVPRAMATTGVACTGCSGAR